MVALALLILLVACAPGDPGPASGRVAPTAQAERVLVAVRDGPPGEPTRPTYALAPLPGPTATRPAPTAPAVPTPAAATAPVLAAARLAPPADGVQAPILMYHRVQDVPPSSRDAILRDLSVPPRAFAAHADLLADLGVESIGLHDLADLLYGRRAVPPRAVVLTFDDGYADTYYQAFPILRERGLRGTVFVVTDAVGQPGYLDWDQLREMAAAGWEVESHSLSHLDLRDLSSAALLRDLRESRATIERELGRTVRYLSYPSGRYDRRVIDAAALAGYYGAVTVNHGTRHTLRQLFELTRVRVHGTDSAATLAARLPW